MKQLALVLSLLTFTLAPLAQAESNATKDSAIIVGVNGMTCSDCKHKVEDELGKLQKDTKYQGKIKAIEVSLKAKNATIKMIESVHLSAAEQESLRKDVADAITKAGYEPVLEAAKKAKKTNG